MLPWLSAWARARSYCRVAPTSVGGTRYWFNADCTISENTGAAGQDPQTLLPESVTAKNGLVYVLNVNARNITGFRYTSKGEMTPCKPLHVVASRCVLLDALSIVFESV